MTEYVDSSAFHGVEQAPGVGDIAAKIDEAKAFASHGGRANLIGITQQRWTESRGPN